jgi:putative ABC transport system ATP-binding protein
MLRAEGLVKSYGTGAAEVRALDGVDLAVAPGELLAVVGRSGSGKTTLLHCLAGLVAPDAGRVLLGDDDLAVLSDDARSAVRATRLGLLFQSLNLLPALTAAENVQLPLLLRGVRAAEVRSRSADALAALGLADRGAARPEALSGGEQQRVALARALVGEPDVLLADEPTGALDTTTSAEVLALLRAAVDAGRSVVVVTHADDVAAAADRVVELRDGRVVGAPA